MQFSNGYCGRPGRGSPRPPARPGRTSWWTRSRASARSRSIWAQRRWTCWPAGRRSGCSRPGDPGFVYVRRELIRELTPAITGWMAFEGTDDFTRLTQYNDTLRGDARRFELITLPYQDFAGHERLARAAAGAGRCADSGVTCCACTRRCWRGQRGAARGSPRRWARTARGSSASRRRTWARPSAALKAARIICSLREGAIRLSPHAYKTSRRWSGWWRCWSRL